MSQTRKVLLAYNNAEFVTVCSKILSKYGLNVVRVFHDGRLLLGKIISECPDIVLMDAHMLTMDAIEVLHAFKKIKYIHSPAFFVLSTENDNDFITRILKSGASDYFPLPFDYEVLVERINRIPNADIITKIPKVKIKSEAITDPLKTMAAQNLHIAGLSPNNIGYFYLRDAICMVVMNSLKLNQLTQYENLSIDGSFDTSQAMAICAMIYSVKTAYEKGNSQFLNRVFKTGLADWTVPNLSKFIDVIAKKIKSEHTDFLTNR